MSGIEGRRLAATNTLTLIGDSLVANAPAQYTQRLFSGAGHNTHFNAKSGSPIQWGIDRLNALAATGQIQPLVVFALGTNETHEVGLTVDKVKARIYTVLDIVGPSRKVLLYGIAREPGVLPADRDARFDIVNQAYSDVVSATGPNVKWADWQAYLDRTYGLSFPWHTDGLHYDYLPDNGYGMRADHMAERLRFLGWNL